MLNLFISPHFVVADSCSHLGGNFSKSPLGFFRDPALRQQPVLHHGIVSCPFFQEQCWLRLATVPLATLSSDVSLALTQTLLAYSCSPFPFPHTFPSRLCVTFFSVLLSDFCSTQGHPHAPLPVPLGASALCLTHGLPILDWGWQGAQIPSHPWKSWAGDAMGKQEWLQLLFPS